MSRFQSQIIKLSGIKASALNNSREIRVYLPAGYNPDSKERYPVLYMHVGQYVFDSPDEHKKTWQMHEVLDRLIAAGEICKLLLVAIEHKAEEGGNELFHDLSAYPIHCSGEKYEHFLIHELKPLIDREFLTETGPASTALMGSSAAGLATYNIGLRNPDVFGRLGIISPYLVQLDPQTLEAQKQYRRYGLGLEQKVWLDIGGAEGLFMPEHVKEAADEWISEGGKQGSNLYFYVDPEGAHSEEDWGQRAHMPLLYFFGDKGKAEHVELYGPEQIGLTGKPRYINAIVRHTNGFAFSDLQGDYEVSDPAIVELTASGRIIPRKAGAATIRYKYEGKEASITCNVVEDLSDYIEINVEIAVPQSTPPKARMYATFEVFKLRNLLYGGTIRLPRGLNMKFVITRGFGKDESDADYQPRVWRRIAADYDQTLSFTVENWMDLKPGMMERNEEDIVW